MKVRRHLLIAVAVVCLAWTAHAQEWRGMGRVAGKVVDEATKQPIEGVTVKAMLPGSEGASLESKTNRKGEWAVGGIARGEWALDFAKAGYEMKSVSVSISEGSRLPPMEIELKKAEVTVDPNAEIKEKMTRAAALMNGKQYAQARAIYEDLTATYPQVPQFLPLIARAYYGEGDKAKTIEYLRMALQKEPNNVEVQLLLGNVLMEEGKTEEGKQVLASVDEARVKDPTIYLNVGIGLINSNKHAEAVTYFEKAIDRFPDQADAYYYRGISNLALGKTPEAKADIEKFVSLAAADAPELPLARKILESLK